MKFLTILSVLQIAAISVLLFKFVSLERSMNNLAMASPAVAARKPFTAPPPRSTASIAPKADTRLAPANIEQLRSVVREELAAALLPFFREQSSRRFSTAPEREAGEERPDSDYEYEREMVRNEIDYDVSRGFISDMEMEDLQRQFAKLDQSGRKEMLRKLLKVLNSGDLKGRL
jgi:hypothetical protein